MKSEEKFETFFWEGISPTLGFAPLYPGNKPHSKVDKERGITCEYNVAVSMRDGIKIYSDIFRPEKKGVTRLLSRGAPMGNILRLRTRLIQQVA
jgi:hypothetical protein